MNPGQILSEAIAARAFPGAVPHLTRGGRTLYVEPAGYLGYDSPYLTPATPNTLYDLASVTKIYTLAAAFLVLHENDLDLAREVREFFPQFRPDLTLRHLMQHTGGWGLELQELHCTDASQWLDRLAAAPPKSAPGEIVKYSCSNTFVLARILEKLTATPLYQLIQIRILDPLGLKSTYFTVPNDAEVAPTEARLHAGFWQGVVHDEAARTWWQATGGCAGNAGLFATAADVATFGQIWLPDADFLPEHFRRAAFEDKVPVNDGFRGLGWQIDNPAYMSSAPAGTAGHLGFTGPCLLVSPSTGHVSAILCNRVHPDRQGPNRLPYLDRVHSWMFNLASP